MGEQRREETQAACGTCDHARVFRWDWRDAQGYACGLAWCPACGAARPLGALLGDWRLPGDAGFAALHRPTDVAATSETKAARKRTPFADSIATAFDAEYEREMLEFRVDDMLRRAGWKHTSSTPGCFWLWEREHEGRVLLVDKKTALAIQRHFDSLAADNSEEVDDG